MDVRDDEGSVDAGDADFDLTPRDSRPRPRASGVRRAVTVGGLVAVVAALGLVLFQGLTTATVFFYNVDEAVQRRDELGDKRVRIQGSVIAGSLDDRGSELDFVLAFGGEEVQVEHSGEPPELFQPAIPVVLEGVFEGEGEAMRFRSDRMLIRHDSSYDEEHEDRVRDAATDADRRRQGGPTGTEPAP